jgi:hypothetical protein
MQNEKPAEQTTHDFRPTGLKLGGEFEFLGTAEKGEYAFDAPPPRGVVKLYYLGPNARPGREPDPPTRAGFFRCPRSRFGAFKRANARWDGFASWGKYETTGNYPTAHTVIVPDRTTEQKARTKGFFRRLIENADV